MVGLTFMLLILITDEVLIEQEDTQNLLKDLKSKMIERIAALDSTAQDNVKVIMSFFYFGSCIKVKSRSFELCLTKLMETETVGSIDWSFVFSCVL